MGASIKVWNENVFDGRQLKHGEYAVIIGEQYDGVIVKAHGDMVISLDQFNYWWFYGNNHPASKFNNFKIKKITPGSVIEIIVDK